MTNALNFTTKGSGHATRRTDTVPKRVDEISERKNT